MHSVTIQVSATRAKRSVDSAEIAHWVGEALSNTDVRDSNMEIIVHSVNVEDEP